LSNLPSPILELQHAPLPLQSAVNQGVCLDSLPFRCFLFGIHVWVLQGVRSASLGIRALVEFDSFIGKSRWHQISPVSQSKRPWWKNPPNNKKFHPKLLGRRNKKIMKNKKPKRTMMIMKVKRSNQPRSFSPRNNWKSCSRWIGPISVSWLWPSKEDRWKVWDSNP
jgi:hypothetical protein